MPIDYSAVTINMPHYYFSTHLLSMVWVYSKFRGVQVRQGNYSGVSVSAQKETEQSQAVRIWVSANLLP